MLYHPWSWVIVLPVIVLLAWSGGIWCRRMHLPSVDVAERLSFGLALSGGVLSYLVLATGLAGWLKTWMLWAIVGLIVLPTVLLWRRAERVGEDKPNWRLWLVGAVVAVLLLPMVASPPAATDWDGLSYHLAAPAIWLREGHIGYIPFMHHSNFPLVIEMQYLWALGVGAGAGGAKVFHWATLLMTIGATLAFARRAGFAGGWAVASLIAVPVVLWEATVAYADLATAAYTLLFLLAGWNAVRENDTSIRRRWLVLAGLMGGFALGTKMTALGSVGILVLLLLWEAVRHKRVRVAEIGWCVGIALLVGAPWYIKTYIYTGNPVYPYFYEIFGGRNWTQENARIYREAQLAFGLGREPYKLLMAPFNLTFYWFRFFDPLPFVGSVGFVYLAGLIPLLFARHLPAVSRWWVTFVLVSVVLWFVLMQQVRYLMPVFPLMSLLCGWLAVQSAHRFTARAIQTAIALQVVWCLVGIWPLWNRAITVWTEGTSAYLERALPGVWQASEWINRHTPREAGVILYDETRGFYLQRRYLWGNPGHHTLIDYASFTDGDMLVRALYRMGYQYVLQNMAFVPPGSEGEHWRRLLNDAIARGALVERFRERRVVVFELRPRPIATARR
ncbi:MAG: ArnT family glycosyltransferase [Armatimonadota bacterium]